MDPTQAFVVAVAAAALVVAIAVFAVAFRRDAEERQAAMDRKAMQRDRAREKQKVKVAAATTTAPPPVEEIEVHEDPVPDPLRQRPEVTQEEYGVTRRKFFNRALGAVFGVFLLQLTLGFLAFLWPKLKSDGFGQKIDAGDVDDIKGQIAQPDGSIAPLFVPAAQAYIVPFAEDPEGSSFEGRPVIASGLMALWQRCVHLGCRVPVCLPSQGFECPCHGSKYNFHGEYEAGPAPRNLDRFILEVNEANHLIVDTGAIIQTARAKVKTINYPQGPSCLSAGTGENA